MKKLVIIDYHTNFSQWNMHRITTVEKNHGFLSKNFRELKNRLENDIAFIAFNTSNVISIAQSFVFSRAISNALSIANAHAYAVAFSNSMSGQYFDQLSGILFFYFMQSSRRLDTQFQDFTFQDVWNRIHPRLQNKKPHRNKEFHTQFSFISFEDFASSNNRNDQFSRNDQSHRDDNFFQNEKHFQFVDISLGPLFVEKEKRPYTQFFVIEKRIHNLFQSHDLFSMSLQHDLPPMSLQHMPQQQSFSMYQSVSMTSSYSSTFSFLMYCHVSQAYEFNQDNLEYAQQKYMQSQDQKRNRQNYFALNQNANDHSNQIEFNQYFKKRIQLNKLYNNKEDKFENTNDNLIFKLNIFYDKCSIIDLFFDAYFKNVSIMLSKQTQIYFYVNREFFVFFLDFCHKTRLFFENVE